jgi:HK97 family phage portal protein
LAQRSILATVGSALRAGVSGMVDWKRASSANITLIPSYLANLLWLISTKFWELAREGYAGNAAVYACLRVLCAAVSEPPLIAVMRDPSTGNETPLPWDHPLVKLMENPNELMTGHAMWELTELYVGITGRACWWKERDRTGAIISLWPLRPDRVGPIYSDSIIPGQRVISGWTYLIPGTTNYIPIPRKDVLTFVNPDPVGDSGGIVEGLGALQVLAREVSADNQASTFVGALLHNHAIPGTILTTKNRIKNAEDASIIKHAFMDQFGGLNRGQPMVIDAETTVTQTGFSLQQLEFPQLRRIAESRIAAAYGVPAILVGLLVGLESGIRATMEEQREYFTETTCSSKWTRYEGQYQLGVAGEYDSNIVTRFDTTKVKALTNQTARAKQPLIDGYKLGAITKNEFRVLVVNLPPREDGDQYLTPMSGTAIDPMIAAGAPSKRAPADAGDDPDGGPEEKQKAGKPAPQIAPPGTPPAPAQQGGAQKAFALEPHAPKWLRDEVHAAASKLTDWYGQQDGQFAQAMQKGTADNGS